jgi:hypothetical protein
MFIHIRWLVKMWFSSALFPRVSIHGLCVCRPYSLSNKNWFPYFLPWLIYRQARGQHWLVQRLRCTTWSLGALQCGIHVISTLNMKIVTSSCAPRVQGKLQGKSMVAPKIKSLYWGEIAIFKSSAPNGIRCKIVWILIYWLHALSILAIYSEFWCS